MARKKKVVETIWTRDITHHIVATLAVFGLVVSSLITTAGVAALGVQAQIAFAQNEAVSQTASAFFGDNRPASAALLPNSSTTMPRPMGDSQEPRMGSTTGDIDHHIESLTNPTAKSVGFCPKISRTINRGNHEATTTGDIGQLQMFIANHFGLKSDDVVTGTFGSTTASFLQKFQAEQGIPQAPTAGPLTRAAIVKVCGQGDHNSDHMMGSSTPGTMPPHKDGDGRGENGSTTTQMPPKMPPTQGDTRPAAGSNTGSSTVTVQVTSPNGGETYAAGSGNSMTVAWVASGVPQGARACVSFVSAAGKRFNFPATGESCIDAVNGASSVIGPLTLTHEYQLIPGSYTAQVTIIQSGNTTSGGVLAKDSSDAAFTLDDSELGVNTLTPVPSASVPSVAALPGVSNASNAASMVDAVSEIGDGYTKLFQSFLSSFGL